MFNVSHNEAIAFWIKMPIWKINTLNKKGQPLNQKK